MVRMTLDLDEPMMLWLEEEVARRGLADPAEVIRQLIGRVQVRQAKIADMQRLVDEGRASGIDPRSPDEIMDDIRRRVRARLDKSAA